MLENNNDNDEDPFIDTMGSDDEEEGMLVLNEIDIAHIIEYYDGHGVEYELEDNNIVYEFEQNETMYKYPHIDLPKNISTPALIRLARRAGISNVATSALDTIQDILAVKLDKIVKMSLVVRDERNVKVLTPHDIKTALYVDNQYILHKN